MAEQKPTIVGKKQSHSKKVIYTIDELLQYNTDGVVFKDELLPPFSFYRLSKKKKAKQSRRYKKHAKDEESSIKAQGKFRFHHRNDKERPSIYGYDDQASRHGQNKYADEEGDDSIPEWAEESDFHIDHDLSAYSMPRKMTYEDIEREKRQYQLAHGGIPHPTSSGIPENKADVKIMATSQVDDIFEEQNGNDGEREFLEELLEKNANKASISKQDMALPYSPAQTSSKFSQLFQHKNLNQQAKVPSGPPPGLLPQSNVNYPSVPPGIPQNTMASPSVPPGIPPYPLNSGIRSQLIGSNQIANVPPNPLVNTPVMAQPPLPPIAPMMQQQQPPPPPASMMPPPTSAPRFLPPPPERLPPPLQKMFFGIQQQLELYHRQGQFPPQELMEQMRAFQQMVQNYTLSLRR